MIDLFRLYAVLVSENLGWLTIVDKQVVSKYLACAIRHPQKTSRKNKVNISKYRPIVKKNMPRKLQFVCCLMALLVSMTTGAIVLMFLGKSSSSTGPLPLSSYHVSDPIEKTLYSNAPQMPGRWGCIEVFYSGTATGNIEHLAQLNGLLTPEDINCHFVVCNGLGGRDGEIQATKKWESQWSAVLCKTWYGSAWTIRICVVADSDTQPTDRQKQRVHALIEKLCQRLRILPKLVYYPKNWQGN